MMNETETTVERLYDEVIAYTVNREDNPPSIYEVLKYGIRLGYEAGRKEE
jgi:hypothetical protein